MSAYDDIISGLPNLIMHYHLRGAGSTEAPDAGNLITHDTNTQSDSDSPITGETGCRKFNGGANSKSTFNAVTYETCSISAWVKLDGLASDFCVFSSDVSSLSDSGSTLLFYNENETAPGEEVYSFNRGSGTRISTTNGQGAAGTWTHLVATFDDASNQAKLYIDGTLNKTQNLGLSANAKTAHQLGVFNGALNAAARLSHVAVWGRVIGQDEVTSLFVGATTDPTAKPTHANTSIQTTSYFDPQPTAVFLFNKGSGTVITNHSSGAASDLTRDAVNTSWIASGLDLSGSQNFMDMGDGSALGLGSSTGLTIQVKIRAHSHTASTGRVVGFHRAPGSSLMAINIQNSEVVFLINDGSLQSFTTPLSYTKFTATVVFTATEARCFINGYLVGTLSIDYSAARSQLTTEETTVGAFNSASSSKLHAFLEHVIIIGKPLSDVNALAMATDPYEFMVAGAGGIPLPIIQHHINMQRGLQ